MKKGLLIVFCFIYFCSSVGVALNLHYCGGKIKGISFAHTTEKNCCGKKMKNKNCCKEKSVVYKVKDNQDSNPISFSFKNKFGADKIYIHIVSILQVTSNSSFLITSNFHSPPDFDSGDSYLINRVIRI